MARRKICVVTANRADYSRVKSVLSAIEEHPDLELQLVVAGSHLVDHYGMTVRDIERDGFPISRNVHMELHGNEPVTMAKSVGLGVVEFSSAFYDLKPDVVVAVVDRYENFAAAAAAALMNIPTAHIQGGEVTGTIDESLRHAMTKLSHIHFPSTELSRERIVRLGEDPKYVFTVGCPATDILLSAPRYDLKKLQDEFRSSVKDPSIGFDPSRPYIFMVQHPVTTEFGSGRAQVEETLEGIAARAHQVLVLWPNIDSGSDDVSRGIRLFKIAHPEFTVLTLRHMPHTLFVNALRSAKCLVGNSSSGIREAGYFGVPVVNIGTRQSGREHGQNVIHAGYSRKEISEAIQRHTEHGPYQPEYLYGEGNAGVEIANILATIPFPEVQKKLHW